MTISITPRGVLLSLLAGLAIITTWAAISTAVYGGWWIPAEGRGAGEGYWMLVAPEQATGAQHGSEAVAEFGSVGRLKWVGDRPDRYSSICDNFVNGWNAQQEVRGGGHVSYVKDTNGTDTGCGSLTLSFRGERHQAYERIEATGKWNGSGWSYH
jgi:hypothetical protein